MCAMGRLASEMLVRIIMIPMLAVAANVYHHNRQLFLFFGYYVSVELHYVAKTKKDCRK